MVVGLPGYQLTGSERTSAGVRLQVSYIGATSCPHCQGTTLRNKGKYERTVRHLDVGGRATEMVIEARKWRCAPCGRQFRQPLPGIPRYQRASEGFQRQIYEQHLDGISCRRLSQRRRLGAATVDRYFQRCLRRQFGEWHSTRCPKILGIDEHFFTRKKGYATTLCDLKKHRIYDVVLGRSEASLAKYLERLEGRDAVRVVCMDLSSTYRALVRRYFPNAQIVADRFHVIRLINHHFLACWRQLDPAGAKNRGLLSLMRRHRHHLSPDQQLRLSTYLDERPALSAIYDFKQQLCTLLTIKHQTRRQCQPLVPRLLAAIVELRQSPFASLAKLGETLFSWRQEIMTMWRFTRNNGITEGLHNKMEVISRQAYGFRNFQNYRLRTKVLCGGSGFGAGLPPNLA